MNPDLAMLADLVARRGVGWVTRALEVLDDTPTTPAVPVPRIAAPGDDGVIRLNYTAAEPTGKGPDFYDPAHNPAVKDRGPGYVIWNSPPENETAPLSTRHTGNGPMDQPIPPIPAAEPEINFRDRPGLNDHRAVYDE